VHEDIAPKFIAGLQINYERASQDLGASPLDAGTTLGPVADEVQLKCVLAYIEEGKKTAQLVTGGKRKGTKGFFIEPTIFLNPTPDSRIYRQEIFGPVIVVKTLRLRMMSSSWPMIRNMVCLVCWDALSAYGAGTN